MNKAGQRKGGAVKSEKVEKAKRIIGRMSKDELRETGNYIHMLWKQIEARAERREQAARNHAAWEKISDQPIGARVVVNAASSNKQLSRGTILEIVSFDTAGRKRGVELKPEQGKIWRFGPSDLEYWEIQPVNEADLSGRPNRMHLSF